jgi:hypothetical protein
MDEENPYASPQSSDLAPPTPPPPPRDGIWRKGRCLVMGRDARLPDVCPITNLPAQVRWHAKVRVLSPLRSAMYLIFCPPIGLLFFAVYALEGTRIAIPLQREVLARIHWHRRISFGLLACGVLLLLTVAPWAGEGAALGGWCVILLAGVYGGMMTNLFRMEHLTADHSWISGPCGAYLERFEEFPG